MRGPPIFLLKKFFFKEGRVKGCFCLITRGDYTDSKEKLIGARGMPILFSVQASVQCFRLHPTRTSTALFKACLPGKVGKLEWVGCNGDLSDLRDSKKSFRMPAMSACQASFCFTAQSRRNQDLAASHLLRCPFSNVSQEGCSTRWC